MACVFAYNETVTDTRCQYSVKAEGLTQARDIKYYIDSLTVSNLKGKLEAKFKGTAQLQDVSGEDMVFEEGDSKEARFTLNFRDENVLRFDPEHPFLDISLLPTET